MGSAVVADPWPPPVGVASVFGHRRETEVVVGGAADGDDAWHAILLPRGEAHVRHALLLEGCSPNGKKEAAKGNAHSFVICDHSNPH